MKAHLPATDLSPTPSFAPAGPVSASGGVSQPYGNAALAEELAAQAAMQGDGTEIAMGRGHVAGMLAGFGIAAANALSSGGLPAMLNPSGYWDTMPEIPRTELVRPAAAHVRPAD